MSLFLDQCFYKNQEHIYQANVRGCSDDREITNNSQSIKKNKSEEVNMINKTIMTAGAFILSMMVLIAATNVDSQVSEQDRDHHKLSGVVVDADTEEGVANATVYIKKKNGDDRMQADRTQQQQQQQHQQDRATGQDHDALEQTTTDQNGEFEFENIAQLRTQGAHGAQAQQQEQHQQQQQRGAEDETFVLVVEAEGYETEEKEINLSDYIDRDRDHTAMDRDQDRDREYDRDRDDKDKDKIKIELTRSN